MSRIMHIDYLLGLAVLLICCAAANKPCFAQCSGPFSYDDGDDIVMERTMSANAQAFVGQDPADCVGDTDINRRDQSEPLTECGAELADVGEFEEPPTANCTKPAGFAESTVDRSFHEQFMPTIHATVTATPTVIGAEFEVATELDGMALINQSECCPPSNCSATATAVVDDEVLVTIPFAVSTAGEYVLHVRIWADGCGVDEIKGTWVCDAGDLEIEGQEVLTAEGSRGDRQRFTVQSPGSGYCDITFTHEARADAVATCGQPEDYFFCLPRSSFEIRLVASCRGDLDGNGVVDFADIVPILAAWGPCPDCPEDLNGDGVVDFGDIVVILAGWGQCE